MPTLTFTSKFSKNTGLLFSPQEIRNSYLYGIKMSNQQELAFSDDDISFHIQAAQKEIENYLGVKLIRQIYNEKLSFSAADYFNWSFIKTTYQVVCPLRLRGYLNTVLQVTYPREWLSSKQESSDELYHKSINLVPAGNSTAITNGAIYAGLMPNLGYSNSRTIPNFWATEYVTGFNSVPADIMQAIGILATINLLYIAGSNVFGAPGMTSSSLSLDGLSQSFSAAANAFESRIRAYNEDLQKKLINLTGTYRGFSWGVC